MTPDFFFQVFAKNSLMKDIFEEEKKLIVEYDFFWKIVPNWVYFGQGEDTLVNHGMAGLQYHAMKNKYHTIQWIKPGILDVIDESYIKHLAKI